MPDDKALYQKANAIANAKIKRMTSLNEARTQSERNELARKAGKASGESRRRSAELRKRLAALLDSNANTYGELPENPLFSKSAEHSIQDFIICALIYRALKGEVSAINSISKLLGMK
ncbi:MAG: hypothetical protein FWG44_08960 [Oscillospiraceae bacterium]|nr:hypothetical protein [Oscillospiraceae bacterium]